MIFRRWVPRRNQETRLDVNELNRKSYFTTFFGTFSSNKHIVFHLILAATFFLAVIIHYRANPARDVFSSCRLSVL